MAHDVRHDGSPRSTTAWTAFWLPAEDWAVNPFPRLGRRTRSRSPGTRRVAAAGRSVRRGSPDPDGGSTAGLPVPSGPGRIRSDRETFGPTEGGVGRPAPNRPDRA